MLVPSSRLSIGAAAFVLALGAARCEPKDPGVEALNSVPRPTPTAPTALTQIAPPPSATAAPAPEPLNVLLITVDSLRADMPWTGYPREIAPNLTRLAGRSTVYENFYSASSYTAKSVSSLLASRYASSLYRSGWFFA
jgi:glucan phosphoethanolaminetransferase (alkaline phosphatase superfamily)